jgi:hypothetical protein
MEKQGVELDHPPLQLDLTPKSIKIHFSAYKRLVLEENHDHELIIEIDPEDNAVKSSRLVRY